MRPLHLAVLVLACAVGAVGQGTYTQIDYPGAIGTLCAGINTAGHISGMYQASGGAYHGFFFDGQTFTTIDYPGSSGTYVYGLNDSDQVVGQTNATPIVGFVYDVPTQTFTQVTFPNGSETAPYSINNAGLLVGATVIGHLQVGFELSGSAGKQIAPPGATQTTVSGVSTAGQLVGYYTDSLSNIVSFTYNHGQYQRVVSNLSQAAATGISPYGTEIVGSYSVSAGHSAGFIYQGGVLQTLLYPRATSTYALGVSDSGIIVGAFIGGTEHGFLWTPPAPKGH